MHLINSRLGHRRAGSVHLADQGQRGDYGQSNQTSSEYWSVHCLATRSRGRQCRTCSVLFLFTVFYISFLYLFSGCICVYVCVLNCIVLSCYHYGVIKRKKSMKKEWSWNSDCVVCPNKTRLGTWFTNYLTTILRLSYDNAEVTIDLWRSV